MYNAMRQKALKVRLSQAIQRSAYSSSPFPSFLLLSRVFQITPSFSAPASLQDGSPFLVSVKASKTLADQRTEGYTVAATSTFASEEDFEHYDTQCEARKELKEFAGQCVLGKFDGLLPVSCQGLQRGCERK